MTPEAQQDPRPEQRKDTRTGLEPGQPGYRQAGIALFLAGFATFSLIYCVQPLLPSFADSFGISPAASSLALSLTTCLLALSILLSGAYSQALGRRGLMFASLLAAATLHIAAALSPNWHGLLVARAIEGLVLGGVPAVAMAWLAEEISPAHLGRSMGLFVAGNAFGGMAGRVIMGMVIEFTSWRTAMLGLGCTCLICALLFVRLLPPSRHFTRRSGFDLGFHGRAWRGHLRNPQLMRIYLTAFVAMSVFVALFNYATFMLSGEPYGLSPTLVSLIFLTYAFGIVSSSLAGGLSDRYGRRRMLLWGYALMLVGTLLTLFPVVVVIIGGIALVTTGFFIVHPVASAAVAPRAKEAKGHAASLFLLFYYLGASIMGSVGGWFWQYGGWPGVVGLTTALILAGLALIVMAGRGGRSEL